MVCSRGDKTVDAIPAGGGRIELHTGFSPFGRVLVWMCVLATCTIPCWELLSYYPRPSLVLPCSSVARASTIKIRELWVRIAMKSCRCCTSRYWGTTLWEIAKSTSALQLYKVNSKNALFEILLETSETLFWIFLKFPEIGEMLKLLLREHKPFCLDWILIWVYQMFIWYTAGQQALQKQHVYQVIFVWGEYLQVFIRKL